MALLQKLQKIRQDDNKAPDAKRKSRGSRVVFVFQDMCDSLWGGSPAVTSVKEEIHSSIQVDQENGGSVLNNPHDQQENSSSCSNSFASLRNLGDDLEDEDEDQMLQVNCSTKERKEKKRRGSVTDFLKKHKKLKLVTKTCPES